MENLIIGISIIFGIIGLALIIWLLIYTFSKSINGKEHIEKYMTEKYGEDWLEQCMEGLRNPEVRKSIADELIPTKEILPFSYVDNPNFIRTVGSPDGMVSGSYEGAPDTPDHMFTVRTVTSY